MKDQIYDLDEFNTILITFLNKISETRNWELNDMISLFKKGIKIYNENLIKKDVICKGLVTTNGEKRRCSRKKKYGKFCGLHYNKEKKYKSIETIETIETISILYLNNENSNINKSTLQSKIENNLALDCINIKSIKLKWEMIRVGCKELYLNNIDNYFYKKNIFNEYIKIGIHDKINNIFLDLH